MNSYAIVTLSGFLDILKQFFWSALQYEEPTPLVLVSSGEISVTADEGKRVSDDYFECIHGPEPFSFPRNANIGIRAAAPHDVFLVNDDVQFLTPGSVGRLAEIAYEHPEVGVLSPQFEGRIGNPLQERATHRLLYPVTGLMYSDQRLCFTGVYIRRAVLDQIGELDERFDGYGRDDDDYCRRVQQAGLKLAVSTEVVMKHGFGDMQYSASFRRLHKEPRPFNGLDPEMTRRYVEKWGK